MFFHYKFTKILGNINNNIFICPQPLAMLQAWNAPVKSLPILQTTFSSLINVLYFRVIWSTALQQFMMLGLYLGTLIISQTVKCKFFMLMIFWQINKILATTKQKIIKNVSIDMTCDTKKQGRGLPCTCQEHITMLVQLIMFFLNNCYL